MRPIVFSTADLHRPKQLDAWREWFATLCEAEVGQPEEDFLATSETWDLGGFGLSRVRAPKLRVTRTPEQIRRNPLDHWQIVIGNQRTQGQAGKNQAMDVPAGQPFAISFGRAFVSARDGDERLQLFLPRDLVPELGVALERAEGLPITGPMGTLLADFIRSLARNASALSDAQTPNLRPVVCGLLRACIAPCPHGEADPLESSSIAVMRMRAVTRFVDSHLHNPSLGSGFICHAVGMSRSQLYRLLECEGGVMNFIRIRRLRRCLVELSTGSLQGPVRAVGARFGFTDASSFARSFRKQFGVAPVEVRNAAVAGHPIFGDLRDMAGEAATMRDILRNICVD